MKQNNHSSRPSERNSSSRRDFEYDSYRPKRRPPSESSSRSSHSRRSSSDPHHDTPNRKSRTTNNGKGASSSSKQRRSRSSSKRRHRSSSLPFLFLVIFAAALIIILRACVFSNGSGGSGNYALEFSSDSQTLVVGESATVSVSGLPDDFDGKILWTSSDSSIVKINDGIITGKAVGSASIAALVEGKNLPATVEVKEAVEGIKSLTLSHSNISILSGETFQLKATVLRENEQDASGIPIIWTSSNTAVARVASDGLITARDVGSASISATVGNQSAVCVVTVEKNPNSEPAESTEGQQAAEDSSPEDSTDSSDSAPTASSTAPAATTASTASATTGTTASTNKTTASSTATANTASVNSIALTQSFAYLTVNHSMTLGATVSPKGTPVAWSSSNDSIATVTEMGVVTAQAPGSVVITAKAGTLSSTCSIDVNAASEEDPPPEQTSASAEIE